MRVLWIMVVASERGQAIRRNTMATGLYRSHIHVLLQDAAAYEIPQGLRTCGIVHVVSLRWRRIALPLHPRW